MSLRTEVPRFVVDASVVAKWHLKDEQYIEQADALLVGFREGRLSLLAPDQIRYEVASAVRGALRTNRLGSRDGRTAIADFLAWHIPTVRSDSLILAAYDQAIRFDCSLYDGLYVALAEMARCPLVYADHRLRNALRNRFPLALWIEDYRA